VAVDLNSLNKLENEIRTTNPSSATVSRWTTKYLVGIGLKKFSISVCP